MGGIKQCFALVLLGTWYNDYGGSEFCIARNIINACDFVCYTSREKEVAFGCHSTGMGRPLFRWLCIIWAVVFSTIQFQDLADQAGDGLCGRRTIPFVMGDGWSKCNIVLPLVC